MQEKIFMNIHIKETSNSIKMHKDGKKIAEVDDTTENRSMKTFKRTWKFFFKLTNIIKINVLNPCRYISRKFKNFRQKYFPYIFMF